MDRLVGVELFAGVGGMSLGFKQAGIETVVAVEKDPIHAITHSRNFPDCATLIEDVGRLSGGDIRDIAGLRASDDVHVLFGGPPCQGFSFGGKRNPFDPRNVGVLEFARLVQELRPLYFVMENVDGLLAKDVAPTLSMFMGMIVAAGYELTGPIQTLDAADFGVPQWRRRLFLLGHRRGCNAPSYPQADTRRVTVSDALSDLPSLPGFPILFEGDTAFVRMKKPSSYAATLRCRDSDPENYRLTGCLLTRHSDRVVRRFRGTPAGAQEPVSRFFRLDLTAQATTLRAGTDISRGRYTAPRPIHPMEARCITVREAARLHSFPDWFQFHPTVWHGFRQVGNAVPPRLAHAVASRIAVALSA